MVMLKLFAKNQQINGKILNMKNAHNSVLLIKLKPNVKIKLIVNSIAEILFSLLIHVKEQLNLVKLYTFAHAMEKKNQKQKVNQMTRNKNQQKKKNQKKKNQRKKMLKKKFQKKRNQRKKNLRKKNQKKKNQKKKNQKKKNQKKNQRMKKNTYVQ